MLWRDFLAWSARFALLATLIVAPWLLGSYPAKFQVWLSYGLAATAFFACLAAVGAPPTYGVQASLLSSVLIALIGLAALVAAQLLVRAPQPVAGTTWAHELQSLEIGSVAPWKGVGRISIAPAATRFQLARLVLVIGATIVGSSLFGGTQHRKWLYAAIAITAAALAVFGMAQKLSWNGMLFGWLPLRFGGQPFATFVNRNNAAGFLNIGLAAALGGIALSVRTPERERRRSGIVVFMGLAGMIVAGVVLSLSRGGAVAMVCGLVVVGLCSRRLNWRLVGAGVAACLLGVGGLIAWLGQDHDLQSRFRTLADPTSALGVRLRHWSDMIPAVRDRPYLGAGLGTYKYVNRPYQRQFAAGWFWNADNQYVEVLVETGAIGLTFVIVALGTLIRALWKLRKVDRQRDLYVSGLFLAISLGLQSATDFGLTLLSLALPALLFANQTVLAARLRQPGSYDEPTGETAPLRLAYMLPALVIVCAAAWEVHASGTNVAFREQLPHSLRRYGSMTPDSAAAAILEGERLLADSPDDAELHAAVARLHVYAYRLGATQELESAHSNTPEGSLWDRSHLIALQRVAALVPEDRLPRIRETPQVQTSLVPARQHFLAASQHCGWLPDVDQHLAMLRFLAPDGSKGATDELLRAALLDAGEPDRQLLTARLAFQSRVDSLGVVCCRRAMSLSLEFGEPALRLLREHFDDEQVIAIISDTPEILVRFARGLNNRSTISHIATELQKSSSKQLANRPRGWQHWVLGQAADLRDDRHTAILELRRAVMANPDELEWKLQLADWLINETDFAGAEDLLRSETRVPSVNQRLEKAIRGRLRTVESGN